MNKSLFIYLIVIVLASGCSKYGYVKLNYPTAPFAYMPDSVKAISIVNRSFKKVNDNSSTIESVVTGEIAGSDTKASAECIRGAYDKLNGWRGMKVIVDHKRLYGTGTRQWPTALDWNTARRICDSTKTDALLVLETFDSNSDIIGGVVNQQVNAILNGVPPPPPLKQIRMNVVGSWRLYDPYNKSIVDQYQSTSFLTFDAGAAIIPIPPPDALPKTAYYAGEEYVQRFFPQYYFVKRDMYKRGKGKEKQAFLRAFRRSEVSKWNEAIEVWKPLAKSSNRKNAGRACLNIAVANEVLGNIDEALNWAQKAYVDYGDKLAKDYQGYLKYRLNVEY